MRGKRKFLLLVGDMAALYGSFFVTLWIGYGGHISAGTIASHREPFLIMYAVWILVLYLFNLYDYSHIKPTVGNIRTIALALMVAAAAGATLFYTFTIFGISPKVNLLINILVFGLIFIGWRRLFFRIFATHFRKDVLILGENDASRELAKEIEAHPHIGYSFGGFIEDLSHKERIEASHALIVANDFSFGSKDIHTMMSAETEIMNIIEAYEKIFLKVPIEFINEGWFIRNIKNSKRNFYYFLKRSFDLLVVTIVSIVGLPFFALIALGIKLEDGRGVFYKQKRVGLYNTTFFLYKFQTYIEGAEKNGAEWSRPDDPRITRFGKFLRRTHMDELPQVINVFRGELSLVGPRPERPEFVTDLEQKIPYFDLRHVIKPGVTGWAQVKFKYASSVLDSYQKFEYDMYYAKNQNLYMDLGIIFRTLQKLF